MSDPEVFICTKSQRVLLWSNGAGVIFDNQEKIRRHIPLPKLKFIRIATTQTQNRVNLFGRFSSFWLWQTLLFWAASYSPKKPESKRENCFQIRIIKACTTQSCIQLQSQKNQSGHLACTNNVLNYMEECFVIPPISKNIWLYFVLNLKVQKIHKT